MQTRTTLRSHLLALPLLALAACGGGEPIDEGRDALASGDHAKAEAEFGKALAKLEPSDPGYLEAKIGYLQAKAFRDSGAAKTEFLALASTASVGTEQYRTIVLDLTKAGDFLSATEVLTAGKAAHPDYDKWDQLIQQVGDRAKSAGDTEALKGLEGLGYVGE